MAEYVELDLQFFEDMFAGINQEFVEFEKPGTQEILFKLPTQNEQASVVVYSSLSILTKTTRGCGQDAIRLILWDNLNERPLGKGKRINRVAKETMPKRFQTAIEELLKLVDYIHIVDFDYVRAILTESKSSFAKSLLENLDKYKRLTDGQLAYVLGDQTPKGYPTFEAQLKNKGWAYDPSFWDEPEQEEVMNDNNVISLPVQQKKVIPDLPEAVESYEDLVSTKGYPYSFSTFNPVQSMVYPFRDEDTNLVIGANTSAGKTICAELLMDETLKKGHRVIYLSPLKSLTQEKYEDWAKRYSEYKITIMTGDYTLSEDKKRELADAHIIVMTSEMADSRTRRMESEKNYWIRNY